MGASDEDSSQSDSTDEHDIEALRLSQEEARAVLDHQVESFRQIDDKAARTFRLEGLLLGLLLTAVSFIARSSELAFEPVVNPWTMGGVALLIASFILAVITFTVTDINTGLGSSDIQRLVEKKYSEKEWLILLLRSEAAWMDDNSNRQDVNAKLLTASHVTLILAIISLTLGVVLPFM